MTYWQAVQAFWNKRSDFHGRAKRSEYWWNVASTTVINALFLLAAWGVSKLNTFGKIPNAIGIIVLAWMCIMMAILAEPGLAVMFRRYHDSGHGVESRWAVMYLAAKWLIEDAVFASSGNKIFLWIATIIYIVLRLANLKVLLTPHIGIHHHRIKNRNIKYNTQPIKTHMVNPMRHQANKTNKHAKMGGTINA